MTATATEATQFGGGPAPERAALLSLPRRALRWGESSSWRLWLFSFLVAAYVFLLTAHWTNPPINDALAGYLPAWQFVHHGTFFLDGITGSARHFAWFVHVHGHLVSNRMPGVILVSVPFEAGGFFLASAKIPAIFGAAVITAAGVANMAVVFSRLGSRRMALVAAAVLALGTGIWTVASAEMWTHGPDMFWISLALLALSRQRWGLTGLALAPAVLTRPDLALAVAVIGLYLAVRERSWRLPLLVGAPSVLALVGVVAWNGYMFGQANLSGGGYGFAVQSATAMSLASLRHFLGSAAGSFVSPLRGVWLYTPILLLIPVVSRLGWRSSPPWARAAALGAIAYAVVQWRLIDTGGGVDFYSNRYMIEPIVMAAPCFYLGVVRWCAGNLARRRLARGLAAASIAITGIGAAAAPYAPKFAIGMRTIWDPWSTWLTGVAVRTDGVAGWLLAGLAVVVITFAVLGVPRGRNSQAGLLAAGEAALV